MKSIIYPFPWTDKAMKTTLCCLIIFISSSGFLTAQHRTYKSPHNKSSEKISSEQQWLLGLGNETWKLDPTSNTWIQTSPIKESLLRQQVNTANVSQELVSTEPKNILTAERLESEQWLEASDLSFLNSPEASIVQLVSDNRSNSSNRIPANEYWLYDPLKDVWNQVADYNGISIKQTEQILITQKSSKSNLAAHLKYNISDDREKCNDALNSYSGVISWEIYDVNGKTTLADVDDISTGFYYLRVLTPGGINTQKLAIQKLH